MFSLAKNSKLAKHSTFVRCVLCLDHFILAALAPTPTATNQFCWFNNKWSRSPPCGVATASAKKADILILTFFVAVLQPSCPSGSASVPARSPATPSPPMTRMRDRLRFLPAPRRKRRRRRKTRRRRRRNRGDATAHKHVHFKNLFVTFCLNISCIVSMVGIFYTKIQEYFL